MRLFHSTGDLTELDLYVFEWLKRFTISQGYPPSITEITEEFKFSSTFLARFTLRRIEAYGFIDIDEGVTRGIRINNLPDPEELGVTRLKLWLGEACEYLRKYCPDETGVPEALKKYSVVVF